MKLNALTVVFIFISICLLTTDKSAVLITVTYPFSTYTATVTGELERSFASASTTDGVFIDAQSAVNTGGFFNDFSTAFMRVVDVTSLTISYARFIKFSNR